MVMTIIQVPSWSKGEEMADPHRRQDHDEI